MPDPKRYLALGMLAVLAGVLVVVYAPGFAPEELVQQIPVEGIEAENVAPLTQPVTVSLQPRDVLLLLLLPLALAGAAYAIVRKRA